MPIPANFSTVFTITFAGASDGTPGVNPWSARALRGTMSPCDLARGINKLARTVNGTLVDISASQMRKYRLELSGNDMAAPALDGVWVGMPVNVNSNVEVAYLTGTVPERPAVPGSERVDGDFTYYCPTFAMLVVDKQIDRQEWAAVVTWSLTLEEI
jgi:hypothetical protein